MMKHYMSMKTHKDNPIIPQGKAMLFLTNGGVVGTNNGLPMFGQPALFPESQAHAILTAWTYVQEYHPNLEEMPHSKCVPEKALQWINGFVDNQLDRHIGIGTPLTGRPSQVSSPKELPPQALPEPDVNLSTHPAPIVQSF